MKEKRGEAKLDKTSATWTSNSAEVKSLHVMLLPDGAGWFAQGLEIDYAACGATPEEAQKNFAEGLGQTCCEHLNIYGHIEKVLNPAPKDAWREYYIASPKGIQRQTLSFKTFLSDKWAHVTEKKPDAAMQERSVESVSKAFPFNVIEFIKGKTEETVPA